MVDFPGPNDPERPKMMYRAACRKLGITPSKKILRSFSTGVINIAHQGVGPGGARALAIALVVSWDVIFGTKVGRIGPKWDKSGYFFRSDFSTFWVG